MQNCIGETNETVSGVMNSTATMGAGLFAGVGIEAISMTQDVALTLEASRPIGLRNDAALADYLYNEETTVIALDADMNVMCSMSNAAHLLADEDGLTIKDGRLEHRDRKVQQGLTLTLAKALADGRRHSMVVPGSWGNAWHVVITPEASAAFSTPPRAVLRIERRHIFRRPDVDTLQSVLGLSHAEARMLCELICGHSVNECAEILDVSVTTVRKHLAATLKKTCCSRQSELMRLVSIVT